MAITSNIVNWNNLISFTSSGIEVAEYYQIKAAIVKRYQEIYGEDIDLATTSADGIFVETICLLINNILQSFKEFYNQLDITQASGIYLDRLCNLMNLTRKEATKSTAIVNLTLDSTLTDDYNTNEITLADKNGNTWTATSTEGFTFKPGITQTIVVSSDLYGPISIPKGYIDRLVGNDVIMTIDQPDNSSVGSYGETDAELRARRNQSLSPSGTTVMESMASSLLSLVAIDDVKIYNNDTTTSITSKDETEIPIHSVYVILRQKQNIEIKDSTVGTIIYEKMTPGIPTIETSGKFGVSHSFDYKQHVLGRIVNEDLTQNVFWKVATSVSPTIVVKIKPNSYYASANNSTANLIISSIISSLNNKQLSTDIDIELINDLTKYADPLFRGEKTYSINSITIDGKDKYENKDTFYYYYTQNAEVVDNTNEIVITIK